LTRSLQAAAAARIAGKPDVLEAAKSGDTALVRDHIAADASCVHKRDDLCDPCPFTHALISLPVFCFIHFLQFVTIFRFHQRAHAPTLLLWSRPPRHLPFAGAGQS